MAAYALTSFLTGAAFLSLGYSSWAILSPISRRLLTGAIGAIGVSLFVLELGLSFPSSATPLSLPDVRSTLFDKGHLGLLVASFFPAFIQSSFSVYRAVDARVHPLRVLHSNLPPVFWITFHALGAPNERLVAAGWLFTVDSASLSASEIVASWNYWALFDFASIPAYPLPLD
ncbi:hypothetical protein K438DRAFT_444925 [Mycena galopus ATCC 62051]|nr:hypothetical protein K438DRAFT_444925 [Mycena galopus ATCC 62051]